MASLSLFVILLLLVILCCSYSYATSLAGPSSTQVDALLKWKSSLTSYGSTVSSWNTSTTNMSSSPCIWNGIICNKEGKVTELQIFYEELEGTLYSFSFSSFLDLSILKLAGTNLHGTIPLDIGTLRNLTYLDLSRNSFSIATSLLHLTTNLYHLNLSSNHINGSIPPHIASFKNFVELDLSDNMFSGQIPTDIRNLSNLEYLDISKNMFNGLIPPQLGYCNKLIYLSLSQNDLNGCIPSEIGNLLRLHLLNLSHNKLLGNIPSSLGQIGNGELSIDLSYNDLEGPIPPFPGIIDDPSVVFGNNKGLFGDILNKKRFHETKPHPAPQPGHSTTKHHPAPQPGHSTSKTDKVIIVVISILSTMFLGFLIVGIHYFCQKKVKASQETEATRTNGDLFSIWNYDGKIAYEDIVRATEDFDFKYCIGAGGYGSVYRANLPSGAIVALKKLHR